jgi:hypothetical protein
MKKWVCQKVRTHIFDDTENYYCTICPPYEGILKEEEVQATVTVSKPFKRPDPVQEELKIVKPQEDQEVGMCVIMMDASSSMTDPAFEGIELSRMRLVANSAASGIFDLKRMQNNPNAYIACFKFDNRVELMFVDTVSNVIAKYKNIEAFSDYLYDELFKFREGTDINKALQQAQTFVTQFLRKELAGFPVKEYTPMLQQILKFNSVDSVSVPNVRVLLYTDGMQYVVNGSKVLNPNPFKQNLIKELNHDILIGAYFGLESDKGCKDLRNLVSNCPIHNVPQFFLFDNPGNIGDLKYLFRMASGASGFCPRCLAKQLHR